MYNIYAAATIPVHRRYIQYYYSSRLSQSPFNPRDYYALIVRLHPTTSPLLRLLVLKRLASRAACLIVLYFNNILFF